MSRDFWVVFTLMTAGFIAGVVLYHLSPFLTMINESPWGYLRDYFIWIWSLPVIGKIAIICIDLCWGFQMVLIIEHTRETN